MATSCVPPTPSSMKSGGRFPGSRVSARDRLPGSLPVAHRSLALRSQLRGQLRLWSSDLSGFPFGYGGHRIHHRFLKYHHSHAAGSASAAISLARQRGRCLDSKSGYDCAMQSFWRAHAHMRPWIAVVVSYAVVLQALLIGVATGLSAERNAESLGSLIICSASGNPLPALSDNSKRAPVHDGICLFCLMAGGAPTVLPPTAVSRLVASAEVISFAPLLLIHAVSRHHTPRQSQGPPEHGLVGRGRAPPSFRTQDD